MVHIAAVTMDCHDAAAQAAFWAGVLGSQVSSDWGEYIIVDGTPHMAFQQVDDPTPGKNRWHVDLSCPDLNAEVDRIIGLGATLVARMEMRGGRWVVLADPEGNEFCVAEPFDFANP